MKGRHILLSAYPVGARIQERLERACGARFDATQCLGEFRRLPFRSALRALRGIEAGTAWVLVTDHDYQPFLPLLLLAGAFTRSGELRVVDFEGRSHSVTRPGILGREPLRLALWTLRGFASLARASRESRRLARLPRLEPPPLPARPRVAYLKTNLWFGLQAGGSVGHVAGVVNGLSRANVDVEVHTVEGLPMLDPAVEVVRIPARGAAGLPLELVRHAFHEVFSEGSARVMRARRPDAVYQRYSLANYAGVVLTRRFGLPLVLEYNGSEVWVSRHWGLPLLFAKTSQRIEEVNLRHAHVVVVVSEVLREELVARGVPASRIVFYPNCVDPRVFDPGRFTDHEIEELREAWGVPSDAVVCLFLGTFGPWHGVEVLASAARRLWKARPEWVRARLRFVFVGDGQLMPELRCRLAELPDDVYRLTGLVPQEEAPLHLAAADVLVSPHVPNPDGSRFFGSPTKLFEYMAMGRAIVASELEQIGRVLAGSRHVGREGLPTEEEGLGDSLALLVAPGSDEQVATALEYLASRPGARARLGRAAREAALARYTWDRHVEAILARLRVVTNASADA